MHALGGGGGGGGVTRRRRVSGIWKLSEFGQTFAGLNSQVVHHDGENLQKEVIYPRSACPKSVSSAKNAQLFRSLTTLLTAAAAAAAATTAAGACLQHPLLDQVHA